MGRGRAWAIAIACLFPIPALGGDRPKGPGLPKSPPRSKEFQAHVDRAVDRGMAWLRKHQKEDGSFSTKWGEGETALALLALRAGGTAADDEQVRRALERLRRAYPAGKRPESVGNSTYGTALTLMALEVHYNSGMPAEAPIPESDDRWIAWLTGYLVRSQVEGGGFGYGADDVSSGSPINIRSPHWWDNSNSQFAILGLGAARLLGHPPPPEVWRKSLRHWVRTQEMTGPDTPWYEPRENGDTLYALGSARSRGWGYGNDRTSFTGSMTAGGVSSIVLCRAGLGKDLASDPELDRDSAASLRDGLAWLGRNFAVEGNPVTDRSLPPDSPRPPPGPDPPPPPPTKPPKKRPGKTKPSPPEESETAKDPGPPMFDESQFYYLYGLERAGVLAETAWVGTHDWYLEGAQYMLKAQREDGSWLEAPVPNGPPAVMCIGEVPDTCFALLFLKRATTRLRTTTISVRNAATLPADEGLDIASGPHLDDAAFRDLLDAVFARFRAGDSVRRAERARDFVRMGTRSIPLLVLRLDSEDSPVRIAAFDALRMTTWQTLGYDPAAPKEARAAAVRAWEEWWLSRKARIVADDFTGRFRVQ